MVEPHELDNITLSNFSLIAQTATIAIQLFHSIEVSIADADDNDRAGQLSELDNLIDSLIHIVDRTIG